MREIPLTRGYQAIVDDSDYEVASQFKWQSLVLGKKTKLVYAVCIRGPRGSKKKCIYLHRLLLEAPPGYDVDHINRDTLDCRRANLRLATRAQNAANGRHRIGASGFRGVAKANERWACYVSHKYYGRFDTPEEAAHRYDMVAREIWGEFATLNFPESVCGATAQNP